MSMQPTQIRFVQPTEGVPDKDTWAITHDAVPEPRDGEITVKLHYVSIDPAIKGWITDKKSYIEAVKPGEVMRGFGVAEVIASQSDYYKVGDFCTGFTGIQTHATMDSRQLRKIDPNLAPLSRFMGGLGMPGFTAYFGLLDIGKPEPGETVVVSSAAGAVGHVVAQIAKLKGCRVVGIAGGPKKCAYLRDELKLDAVIDYRKGNLLNALNEAAPSGVDVYFDGVGGETLDSVLLIANRHARIIACGAVSQYESMDAAQGLKNYMLVITQSLMIKGFTMRDYMRRIKEAFVDLLTWEHEGKIRFREHVLEGIERYPEAVEMIYAGKNNGKLMIKVSD